EDRALHATCRGEIDLGIVSAVFPALNASGPIAVDLEASGTLDAPDVRGTIEVRDGRARLAGVRETLEQIDLLLRVTHESIAIERFRAILGGGEVSGAGSATLKGATVDTYRIDLEVQSAVLTYPEGFRGVYDGTLAVAGTAQEGRIRGTLHLLQGIYG